MRWLINFFRRKTAAEAFRDPKMFDDFCTQIRSLDLSDEKYREIYGDDEEAIRQAKESWARAGEEVIESTKRMMRGSE